MEKVRRWYLNLEGEGNYMLTDATQQREEGELFSLLLRLHPLEAGCVLPGAGNQIQAAFLEIVRESDPALAAWLHAPHQRRPYTLSLLQGFNHLTNSQLSEAMSKQVPLEVMPGQVYWLRITMLDAAVFGSFVQYLIMKGRALTVRIGNTHFEISRVLAAPETQQGAPSWVAYASFAQLATDDPALTHYHFEFASPTAFSKGQQSWGKRLDLFPDPATVFDGLACQWECFATAHLRIAEHGLTPGELATWCKANVIVAKYALQTRYLPSSKFGQTGFQGEITYEVKGDRTAREARWLTPLARLALFSGIGYKTAMGMGQARCINVAIAPQSQLIEQEVKA